MALQGSQPPDWMAYGLCAQTDPDAFFPEKGGSTLDAKRVCRGCGVREACLSYALENDERFGIWGGLSERERRALGSGTRRWARGRVTDADAGVRKVAA